MEEEKLRKIKELLDRSNCPNGCRCYHVNRDEICKARSMGLENLLECLEGEPETCTFAIAFGGSYFCKCQTRIALAKILED